MNFVFLVDQYERWNVDKDTSFILMMGAHRREHNIYLLHEGGISSKNGKLTFSVIQVHPQKNNVTPFINQRNKVLTDQDIDIIFIRTDPPFDNHYLMQTWLLDLLPKHIPIINKPNGIRQCNEKVWATQFTDLIPPTLVSTQKSEILKFIQEYKLVVAKPTDGFGGKNILRLSSSNYKEENLSELTKNWTQEIIVQEYIKEAENGDKRILLLNGEPIGAVLRLHGPDDFRNNFMTGGTPHATGMTQQDLHICSILKPHLIEKGLYLVGIDVIGSYLTEVNVTSPTGMQEINNLNHTQLEEKVITFAEKLIDQFKTPSKI
ncbi:MAG: glutathione synthase [Candidatus Omnitrophica bacterium]|nr:glutathione synthase [Candidatus Omnitrophota bacterium]